MIKVECIAERIRYVQGTLGYRGISRDDDWFFFTSGGVVVVVIQLCRQAKQSRLDSLSALYAQLDTHAARLARGFIYDAPPGRLRLAHLKSANGKADRELVEETLATMERMAYPIAIRKLSSDDAFNLYGGVLLSVALPLWPYIMDRRAQHKARSGYHRLGYRRYLEAVVREWAPKYARAVGIPLPGKHLNTEDMLRHVLEV